VGRRKRWGLQMEELMILEGLTVQHEVELSQQGKKSN